MWRRRFRVLCLWIRCERVLMEMMVVEDVLVVVGLVLWCLGEWMKVGICLGRFEGLIM